MRTRRFFFFFTIVGIVTLAFWSGVFVGVQGDAMLISAGVRAPHLAIDVTNKATPSKLQNLDFNLFWEVWDLVKQKYVNQPVSDETLYYGALRGLVGALDDPYSVFLTPKLSERFAADLSGSFGGIGAEIGMRKGQLMIIAPLSGSPAEKAGLKAGDAILEIDNKDTSGITLDAAVDRIRGPKGTTVTLKIFRDSFKKPKDFTVTRDTIVVKSVDGYRARLSKKGVLKKNEGTIAYIKLSNFNEDTT
ncbi:PDZ domain-containing protein, partial [Candidatus Uhrbacteria bacterium]|nr:PDZ domain-containing protein [Candidatus Uhrbacteria bacterium]